ncbi:MAG: 1-acyl-sn-glycerol-3-phosphate acyltransferase [Clostridiales bacterium]|jgi:1-acyl-sn-glycerol-3-phosphate acyltransferase|nr:1-acyl-sn-glycerol-3-phosphate acyltransferase [Clostridiales bacterium]
MWPRLFTIFVKITGALPMWVLYRPKVLVVGKGTGARRRLPRACVVVSNHTGVWDYAVILLVFPFRFLRYLMAELLFEMNKFFSFFLRSRGGIYVNRKGGLHFLRTALDVLYRDGAVGIFPESRLPDDKTQMLPFTTTAVQLALRAHVPIVPVYLTRRTRPFQRVRVAIGAPVYYFTADTPDAVRVQEWTRELQDTVARLGEILAEKKK